MRISLELVPRNEASFQKQLEQVRTHFPQIDTINVPDLLRFELRSWRACACARRLFAHAIPHLRAIDIDLDAPLACAPLLRKAGIDEVLVVAGDAPVDMSRSVYGSSSVQVIRKLRRELPEVRVYAALDPYRQNFVDELEYAHEKLEAGAVGLFTQPFFDLRLLELWSELLTGIEVFWGVTSVTTEGSMRYWRARNKVVFPGSFEATLAWNRSLAQEALELVQAVAGNIYFMPIRTGIRAYLGGIL